MNRTFRFAGFLLVVGLATAPVVARGDPASPPPGRILAPGAGAVLLDLVDPRAPGDPEGPLPPVAGFSLGPAGARFRCTLDGRSLEFRLSPTAGECTDGVAAREFCVRPDPVSPASLDLARRYAARLDASSARFLVDPATLASSGPSGSAGAPSAGAPPEGSGTADTLLRRLQSSVVATYSGWFWFAAGCWLLLVLAFLSALPGWIARRSRQEWSTDLVLVAASLAIRLLVATFGPGDLVTAEFSNLFRGGESSPSYGPGPDPLLVPPILLTGSGDRVVVGFNLLLGSLCPSLLLAFLRRIPGLPDVARIAAALVLVFLPLPVRYAGECNRTTLVLFLALVALSGLAGLAGVRRARIGSILRGLAAAFAGFSLAALTRPEGALLLFPMGLLALALTASSRSRWPLIATFLAASVFGAIALDLLVRNPSVASFGAAVPFASRLLAIVTPDHQTWLDPLFTPLAWVVFLALGAARALRRRDPFGGWALLGLAGLGFLYASAPTGESGGAQLSSARYQVLAGIPLAVLVGTGAAPLLRLPRPDERLRFLLGGGIVALLTVLSLVQSSRSVEGPTDIDHEYRLLRSWIPDLPPGAEIHYVHGAGGRRPVDDISLRPPDFLSFLVGRPDVSWHEWPYDPGRPGRPRFLLLPSVCAEVKVLQGTTPGPAFRVEADACDAALRAASTVPFRFARVPYRRYLDARTLDGSIPIGLFPLPDRSPDPSTDPSPDRRTDPVPGSP